MEIVMADTAFRTIYVEEWIDGLEERESWLRKTVTTKANISGNDAVFLVADSGSANATTRGADGLIPARPDVNVQSTARLVEWHDLVRKTSFTVDLSQGDQRRIMQTNSMGVINRKIDADIIAQLDTATINTTPAATASVAMVMSALAELGNSYVKIEDEESMFGLISNSFWAYMMQTAEFNSGDYVDMKWFSGKNVRVYRWAGVNWIRHPQLTGVGTGNEKCYLYHKEAIGHAMDKDRVNSIPGYDDEQDYHWVRTSGWFGSKKLQDAAIVQMLHDGSAHNLS
jgi:hypothetical protein